MIYKNELAIGVLLHSRGLTDGWLNVLVRIFCFLSVNLSGKEIDGGGHFEEVANRFCVAAKPVSDCF